MNSITDTTSRIDTTSRHQHIQSISSVLIDNLLAISVEHMALPVIAGFSLDELSQEEYEKMGGKGPKPKPLSPEVKLEIYNRMLKFYRDKLLQTVTELVNSMLNNSLRSLSEEELKAKSLELKAKIKSEPGLDWNKMSGLISDHTYFYKDLKSKSGLNIDTIAFHDKICPIISHYRDSGELFHRINIDALLQ